MSIANNDVMPHKLVLEGGPSAIVTGANMNHMAATSHIKFAKAGTYKFITKAGEDYPGMMQKTIGPDNNLKLTVVVA